MDALLKRSFALYTFLVFGIFLAVAPWTPVWYEATFLLPARVLGVPLDATWVRGVVSGIGVLDLWVVLAIAGEVLRLTKKKNGGARPPFPE